MRFVRVKKKRHDFRRRSGTERAKRLMDVTLASIGLILTLPVFAIIVLLLLATQGGAVLYRQVRVGRGGRVFTMIKFRTMRRDAERDSGPVWATVGDPRVTSFGRLLRRSHADELPQLWNVLRGEMSLVGPRPERPEFVESFRRTIPRYAERNEIRPGITGLAQLRCGYDASIETVRRKLTYDLHYIRSRSLRTDLGILGRTFLHVVSELVEREDSAGGASTPSPRPRAMRERRSGIL